MANIPLRDIPDLPKYDVAMPVAKGQVPDLPKLSNIRGQLEQPYDFEKNARQLTQEGAGVGAGIIAKSMFQFGETMSRLGEGLAASKQAADVSRVNNEAAHTWLSFNETADKEQWQQAERLQRWSEEWGPQLNEKVQGMGLSSWSQSEALPKLHLFIHQKNAELQHNLTTHVEGAGQECAHGVDPEFHHRRR